MLPIEVTLVGILTDISAVHPSKAKLPMVIVVSAKVITQKLVVHRLQQPVPSLLLQETVSNTQAVVVGKALLPMVLGIMESQKIQGNGAPSKADDPIVVTLLGIVTDISLPHDWKAEAPIVITLLGTLIDFSDVHERKAKAPIVITLVGISTDISSLH